MSSQAPVLQSRRALYIGGLDPGVEETTLRAAFLPFGPISSEFKQYHDYLCIEYYQRSSASSCGSLTLHLNVTISWHIQALRCQWTMLPGRTKALHS